MQTFGSIAHPANGFPVASSILRPVYASGRIDVRVPGASTPPRRSMYSSIPALDDERRVLLIVFPWACCGAIREFYLDSLTIRPGRYRQDPACQGAPVERRSPIGETACDQLIRS